MSRIPETGRQSPGIDRQTLGSGRQTPDTGQKNRASAALLAGLLIAGTSLPALATGQGDPQASGESVDGTGDMSVQEAWANARQDWRELQAASGEAWDEAQKEFQDSWSRLQRLMSEQDGTAPPPDDPAGLEQDAGAQ